ncbi:TATA box-binding protein-associated factor, RNA polymerase I, subunit C-like [Acanthaster planci]|uniref:TATA box-binding protein-associated factor, RNA polymerase I, subunit C-like n=1 Tax=Acanthaster planci TaxID=133434 RepID=A0A8B7ZD85_ACAPL|nr:TATA box-binding protein-associated factor, RNA polymerase I, subunit C-like [Acanthaster planci]XP_022102929.1 TATA box-binding protein-associated factor, RNA polymerase I, subunit C-like [Acanthaster planci]XP_022102930.1 TATA box-binding protein-associated factor, RNA polymerase I, subunit C-like [Acanthaster planci]XP_022102931.1 TATA box-binding protein-associated factor, RNA polymerase I, subunit C-like [Acanthaster planci]XP_022102932.1 TATA box-binding protein-associated factor, RNA 
MSGNAFPETHYPGLVLSDRRTQLPDGYGCFQAADLETGNSRGKEKQLRFKFQYRHGNKKRRLEAQEPTLPLLKPQQCFPIPLPDLQDLSRTSVIDGTLKVIDRAVEQAYYFYQNFPHLVWGSALDFLEGSYVDNIPVTIKSKDACIYIEEEQRISLANVLVSDKVQLYDLLEPALYDIHPDMLLNLLKEDINENIHKLYVDQDFYGGCLSYQSLPPSSLHEGLLFYPTGPTLEELNIRAVPHQDVPIYSIQSSPSCQFDVVSPLRQIETVCVPYRRNITAAVRSDYSCCVLDVKTKKDKIKAKVSNFVHSQQKIASVALSPYIHGECLLGLDTGGTQLINPEKKLQCIRKTPELQDQSACRCHYSGHPRLIVTHQTKRLDLVDCRAPEESGISRLLSIPSENLTQNQEIFVAKQHPSNHFYHLVATQDLLLLMDQRFPKYNVLQWCHSLRSPPNCMDIIPSAEISDDLPSDLTSDLIVLASQSSREVHCFQCSELNGQTPESTSVPWKIASTDGWFDMLPEYPTADLDPVRSRLERPLIGMSAAKRISCEGCEPGVTVFQLTTAGDVFFQTYTQKMSEDRRDKTLSYGPGCPQVHLSKESLMNCKQWVEGVVHQARQETNTAQTSFGFKKVNRETVAEALKDITQKTSPSRDCRLCRTTDSDQPDDYEPTDQHQLCPACGVKIADADELKDCVEAGGRIVFKKRRFDEEEGEEMGPLEKINPRKYRDEMSKMLHHAWVHGYDAGELDQDDEYSNEPVAVTPHRPPQTPTPVTLSNKRKSLDPVPQDAPDGFTLDSQSLDLSEQRISNARLAQANRKKKPRRSAMGF